MLTKKKIMAICSRKRGFRYQPEYVYFQIFHFNLIQYRTQMLNIARQNHLAVYDSRQLYVASFVFELIAPQPKNKTEPKAQFKQENEQIEIQIKNQYNVSFFIDNAFTFEWQSTLFDMEAQNNEVSSFGTIPFSLETYLDMFKNPKHWNIVLRPKSDDISPADVLKKHIGKLVIKTQFRQNPFIVPIHCLTQALQVEKNFKVILQYQELLDETVVCSAEFQSMQIVTVDSQTFKPQKTAIMPQKFKIFTFKASQNISCQNICIIKGVFELRQLEHRGRKIQIYSANNKPVTFISNLQRTMKILKFIDNDIIIFQNVQTLIEDSYRLIFFTDLTSLYSKIFRSFLYSKIVDKWIIQGMVHYSRDNRHFQDIMQELTDLLSEGEELFPLCNGQYNFDHVWKVKAKFIYHVLANLSDSDLTQRIILQFSKKKKKLTSAVMFKKLKNNIGKDKMKTIYEHQFINSTGINRIFYEMEHVKKQHKIKITLRQRALVCPIFRRYNKIRIKLEQSYKLVSPIMQKIIKKNQGGRRSQMSGPLAVPKFIKCLPYFIGPVNIQIENSQPFEEQLQEQNIFEKVIDAKTSLRARRTGNKKSQQDTIDTISWMMMDSSVTFPAVYKGKNLSQGVIQSLLKKSYQNQIQQLKILNSISIKQHSQSLAICKLLIEKIKIKPNKQNSKISVKRKIFQLLPNFISKSNDVLVWDEILQLLQLYQPVCYDYSEQGNLFLLSMIESIGNITYTLKFNLYFEEFHRIFLALSRYHHCINEEKFQFLQKQLFRSLMKWVSKYSFEILIQVKNYLCLTLSDSKMYLILNKIIIENALPYIDQLKIKKEDNMLVKQINELIKNHAELDKSGTIRSVLFHYETKINQIEQPPLKFLDLTFSELQKIKEKQFEAYDKCLDKFKEILNKNRQRYALQIQIQLLNQNQNYFLAEYLWKNMCSPESFNNARIRLMWIKIYRIFYFYFTPIVTMVKLNKNASTKQFSLTQDETFQVLDNVMDFVPDIRWFSVYDSSNSKKKKTEKKKELEEYSFDDKDRNMFTDYIAENPGKDTPEQLTKYALTYLIREYQNQEIKNSGEERFKRIIQGLKSINQLLKRSNLKSSSTYQQVPQRVFNLLYDYNQDDGVARQVFDTLNNLLENIKKQKRERQMQKDGDMRISLLSLDIPRYESVE